MSLADHKRDTVKGEHIDSGENFADSRLPIAINQFPYMGCSHQKVTKFPLINHVDIANSTRNNN